MEILKINLPQREFEKTINNESSEICFSLQGQNLENRQIVADEFTNTESDLMQKITFHCCDLQPLENNSNMAKIDVNQLLAKLNC